MQFEIGKTYETTISNFYRSCGLVGIGQRFTCHRIDSSGDAWSTDVQFCGEPAGSYGWCVATAKELSLGYVREVTDMKFAPTTAYIVDVTTADKVELMAALKDVPGITSVEDGGMYREDNMYSQVHIEALNAVWSLEQLDELLYSLNYDVVGIVGQLGM